MTDRIYSAQARFLTFEEADILDRVFTMHLQMLEQQGQSESQEANLIRQILRDCIYFTSADTLDDLESCLLASGWQCALSRNNRYHLFWPEGEALDQNKRCFFLPLSMQFPDANDMIIQAMYFLAFLEGGPENCSAYDILQQVREHAKSENRGQKE